MYTHIHADMFLWSSIALVRNLLYELCFQVSACIKTGAAQDDLQKAVQKELKESGKEAEDAMKEVKKEAADIGNLYLDSKKGVTKMDEEVEEMNDKIRKKGKQVSDAKKALNEKCIEECSTGMYSLHQHIYHIIPS